MSASTRGRRPLGRDEIAVAVCLAVILGWIGAVTATGALAGALFGDGAPDVSLAQAGETAAVVVTTLDDPAAAWPASARAGLPGPVGFAVAAGLLLAAAVAALTGALVATRRVREARGHVRRLGSTSTAWASRRSLRRGKLLTGDVEPNRLTAGHVGGRRLTLEPEHSLLVAGATRSGKSTGLVVPNILEWDGPVVVLSAKTDLLHWTRAARTHRGRVWTYDPTGCSGVPTDGWSPLYRARTWAGALRTAEVMAGAGQLAGLSGGGYWQSSAAMLLAPLLHAAATHSKTMGDVITWVQAQDVQPAREMLSLLAEDDPTLAFAVGDLTRFAAMEDRQRDSVFATTASVLKAYSDPGVLATSRATNIRPERLLDGDAHTLYIVAGQADQARLAPLLQTLLDEQLRGALEKATANRRTTGDAVPDGGRRLLVVLDEAANIAPLDELPMYASMGGGEGITLLTVYQDLGQVREAYKDAWGSVFSNHVAKTVLPGITDPETLRTFGQVIGEEEVVETSTSRSSDRDGTSVSRSVRSRDVITTRELRQLPEGQGVLVYGNRAPIRYRLRPFYADPDLTAQVETTPAAEPHPEPTPAPPAVTTAPPTPKEPATVPETHEPGADTCPDCIRQMVTDGQAVAMTALGDPPPVYDHAGDTFYLPTDDASDYEPVTDEARIATLRRALTRLSAAAAATDPQTTP